MNNSNMNNNSNMTHYMNSNSNHNSNHNIMENQHHPNPQGKMQMKNANNENTDQITTRSNNIGTHRPRRHSTVKRVVCCESTNANKQHGRLQ